MLFDMNVDKIIINDNIDYMDNNRIQWLKIINME